MADTVSKTMQVKVLHVTKTTAEWAAESTVITKGLLCIEFTTDGGTKAKVGDGVNQYKNLPYLSDGSFNISNYYTSDETDTAISDALAALGNVVRIKGVKSSVSELPATGNEVGDIWFVGTSGSTTDDFVEYVWTESSGWEYLGKVQTEVDLSPYAKKEEDVKPLADKLAGIEEGANKYVLPSATASTLGGIKVGTNLSIDGNGVLSATDTIYDDATQSASGLMSATDKAKLDGIDEGANNYVLPKATTSSLGGVKVGSNLAVDTNGVISGNYSNASSSAAGLMSSTDKAKLDAIDAEANKYVLPTASATELGGIKVGTNLSVDANGVMSAVDTTYTFTGGNNKITVTPSGGTAQSVSFTVNKVNNHTVESDVPANAKFTDTTYDVFNTTANGLVPKPTAAEANKVLSGAGTWVDRYDDTALAKRVSDIEDDYIKSTDFLVLNCTL